MEKEAEKEIRRKVCCTKAVSAIAIAISIAALCLAFCRIEPVTIEWLGVLVGILSILVVVLIGWQIYSFINIKEDTKELKPLVSSIGLATARLAQEANLLSAQASAEFYYTMLTDDRRNLEYNYINNSLMTIMHASAIPNIELCNTIVRFMLEVIVGPETIRLNQSQYDWVFLTLTRIRNVNEIHRFSELVQVLSKIQVRK